MFWAVDEVEVHYRVLVDHYIHVTPLTFPLVLQASFERKNIVAETYAARWNKDVLNPLA